MTDATKRKRQVVIDSSSSSETDFNESNAYDSYRVPAKIMSSEEEDNNDDENQYGCVKEYPPSELSGAEDSDVAEKCDEMQDSVRVSDLDDTDVNKTVDFDGSWIDDEKSEEQGEESEEKNGANIRLTAEDFNVSSSESEQEKSGDDYYIPDGSGGEGTINNDDDNDRIDDAFRLDESLIGAAAASQINENYFIQDDSSPKQTGCVAQNVTYVKSSPSLLVSPRISSSSASDSVNCVLTEHRKSSLVTGTSSNKSYNVKQSDNKDSWANTPPNDANVSIRRHTRRPSSNAAQQPKVDDLSTVDISSEDGDFSKHKPSQQGTFDSDDNVAVVEKSPAASALTVVVPKAETKPKTMTTKPINALLLFDNKENASPPGASKKGEEVAANVHSALSSAPTEDMLTDTPKGVRIELMPHQKHGLSWLLWREQQNPPSGILADDMGLGKTLSLISLIVEKKNRRLAAERSGAAPDSAVEKLRKRALEGGGHKLIQSNSTLIVAPASLIYQWEKEIQDRVKTDLLSVYVFHGAKRQRDCLPRTLAHNDIVITTYQTLASELSEKRMLAARRYNQDSDDSDNDIADINSPNVKRVRVAEKRKISKNSRSSLAQIAWERIVLDEAHQIKNRKSLASRAVCRLVSVHRWCLTGTPIHNELWDLYSLIRFMHVRPFDEEKMWQEFIMVSSRNNTERLNTLVKSLLLRRTKQQTCQLTKRPILDLVERRHEVVMLDLKNVERRIYDVMFAASKQKVRDLLNNQQLANYGIARHQKKPAEMIKNPFLGGKREVDANSHFQQMSSVLTLLLRLRQACVHMFLTRSGIDLDAFRDLDLGMEGAKLAALTDIDNLEEDMANMSLVKNAAEYLTDDEDDETREKRTAEIIERVFEPSYLSTKVEAALDRLAAIVEAKDKCVIVSQWTTMLDLIESHLRDKHIKFTSITGAVETKDRHERVNSFNRTVDGAQVMLLSLTAGGVGLNLVGGNHLFLLDLHWNPALEQQACDRIYRMGQTKNVFIHKFLCNGTIEQRVLDLQEKKSAMAKSVLEGAAKKNKLTVADIKFLFDLDNRAQRAQTRATTQKQQPTKPP